MNIVGWTVLKQEMPNKHMRQTGADLAEFLYLLSSDLLLRNERLNGSSTAPAADALIR